MQTGKLGHSEVQKRVSKKTTVDPKQESKQGGSSSCPHKLRQKEPRFDFNCTKVTSEKGKSPPRISRLRSFFIRREIGLLVSFTNRIKKVHHDFIFKKKIRPS